jgi:hypothetical protein
MRTYVNSVTVAETLETELRFLYPSRLSSACEESLPSLNVGLPTFVLYAVCYDVMQQMSI